MSQGKKVVTVVDEKSCQRKQVAVDEARYNTLDHGIRACFKAWDSPYLLAQDSQEGMAFLVSQLAYTEQETYAREYQEAQYRQLVPVTSEAGPDAASVRYQVYDRVGQGKRINGAAKDVPYADVAASTVEVGVVTGGAGYQYTQEELVQAARMVRPLPSERMATAVEMAERHLNNVAMLGEATTIAGEAKYSGLLNYPSVTTHNNGTAGYHAAWNTSSTTADEVLADINKAILAYWTGSNYTALPNVFGLAPACYSALATRYNSLGTKTLLQLVQESNMTTARTGEKVEIVPILQAATAGIAGDASTGKTRCVFYRNEKRRLVMHVPMPLKFLAPQPEGLMVSVPGWYRYAGLNVRYLYTMLYLDNMD